MSLFDIAVPDLKSLYLASITKFLPTFDAGLVAGTVLGSSAIYKDKESYSMLATVGLTHVVVVSGYNLSLVRHLCAPFVTRRIVMYCILMTYILLCGFSPPILRAFIQLLLLDVYSKFGIRISSKLLLLAVFLILISIFPSYISSKSNYLSFLATYGIMWMNSVLPPAPRSITNASEVATSYPLKSPAREVRCILSFFRNIFNQFKSTFYETLFAQLYTWPYISFYFGRISLISFLVNPLVLWTIPGITVLGFLDFFLFFMFKDLIFVRLALLPFTRYVYSVSKLFSQVPFAAVNFRVNIVMFWTYTIGLEILLNILAHRRSKKYVHHV